MSFDSEKPFSQTDMSDLAPKRIIERAEKIMGLDALSALHLIGAIDHAIGFRKWDLIVDQALKSAREALPRVDQPQQAAKKRKRS